MTFYELEYRIRQESPDEGERPWIRIPPQPAEGGQLEVEGLASGTTYDVRVRSVELEGEVSDWTYLDPVTPTAETKLPPSFPLGIRVECDSFLNWDFPLDRPDLAGFMVRTAIGNYQRWEDMVPAHDGTWRAPPFPVCNLPRGEPRTFAVRSLDVDGNLGPVSYFVVNRGPYEDAEPSTIETAVHADPFLDLTVVDGVAETGVLKAALQETAWHPDDSRPAWSETPSTTPGWGASYRDLVVEFHYDVPAYASAAERMERVLTVAPVVVGENWQLYYKLRSAPAWTGVAGSPGWTGLPGHRGWTSWGDDAPGWGDPADPGWSKDQNTPGWGFGKTPWVPWPGRLKGLERQRIYFLLVIPGGRQRGELSSITVRISRPTPVPPLATFDAQVAALQASIAAIPTLGRYLGTTVLSTVGNQVFTKQAATTTLVVEMVGGGGAGGSADTGTGAPPPTAAAAGGGAAAAYLRKTIVGAAVSYPCRVGAAGVGAPGPGAPAGGAGQSSTFGAAGAGQLVAPGGGGGIGAPNTLVDAFTGAGICAPATGGDVNGQGAPGHGGMVYGGATVAVGGAGGSSLWGAGGDQVNNGPGFAAGGYGAGGGGGGALGGAASGGGNGSQGLILVHEYS